MDSDSKPLHKQIAQALGETDRLPKTQIYNIIQHFGADFAQQLLEETLTIQANGGMMTSNGKRPRTVGGIYLFLARQRAKTEDQQAIFRQLWPKRRVKLAQT